MRSNREEKYFDKDDRTKCPWTCSRREEFVDVILDSNQPKIQDCDGAILTKVGPAPQTSKTC